MAGQFLASLRAQVSQRAFADGANQQLQQSGIHDSGEQVGEALQTLVQGLLKSLFGLEV